MKQKECRRIGRKADPFLLCACGMVQWTCGLGHLPSASGKGGESRKERERNNLTTYHFFFGGDLSTYQVDWLIFSNHEGRAFVAGHRWLGRLL